MDDYWYFTETQSAELDAERACELTEILTWFDSVIDRVLGWFKR